MAGRDLTCNGRGEMVSKSVRCRSLPMRLSILLVPTLSLCLLARTGFPACAQNQVAPDQVGPDQEAPATTNAPANPDPQTPSEPNPPDDKETRNAARRAQVEMRLRAMMSDFGIDEAVKQDAVIAYLAEDEIGRNGVRDAARRLMMAVKSDATPARIRDLIAVYKASLDADKERRRAAQSALDARIGFSLSPRLEAILWLFGVLGEGQAAPALNAGAPRISQNSPRKAPGFGARRAGTVTGTITEKGEGWLEVRDENSGTTERYLPFWTALDPAPEKAGEKDADAGVDTDANINGNYNRAVLETMKAAQVGDRVRLEWVWNERKRVVRLAVLPAVPKIEENAATDTGAIPD